MIDKELLELLACPACESRPPLRENEEAQALVCEACGRHYPIREGIPVLLVEEATMPDRTETDRPQTT